MRRIFIFFLLVSASILDAFTPAAIPVCTPFETASKFVHGVDVTTGDFVEANPELVVKCDEPIALYRTHISVERRKGKLQLFHWDYSDGRGLLRSGDQNKPDRERCPIKAGADWHFENDAVYLRVDKGNNNPEIILTESNGTVVVYKPPLDYNFAPGRYAHSTPLVPITPLSNIASEFLGGGTHLANYQLYFDGPSFQFLLTTGSGEKRVYRCFENPSGRLDKHKRNKERIDARFALVELTRPNGNKILYDWGEEGKQLLHIKSVSADGGTVFGWVSFSYGEGKTTIITSDSQVLTRHYGTELWMRPGQSTGVYLPYTFTGSSLNGTQESIRHVYEERKNKLLHIETRRRTNERDELVVEFYHAGDGDELKGKVRCLHSSKGLIARFEYQPGTTRVYDARGNLQLYHHDGSRLYEVHYFEGSNPHPQNWRKKECFEWLPNGDLRSKRIEGVGGAYYVRSFIYDLAHNVIEERYLGGPTYSYTYSADRRSLCLSRSDGRTTERYQYKPSTDLLESVLVYDGEQLVERRTFEYDNQTRLIQTTYDHGPLTPQLSRRISRKWKTETIEDRLLDPTTGQEELLSKSLLHRDHRSYITQLEQYDSNGQPSHSLAFDHDYDGRLTKEIGPLGDEVHYSYSHRALEIKGPKPDSAISCRYDGQGNLISKRISDALDSLVCHYVYNALGQLVAQTDENGSTTRFYYDCLGHLKTIEYADGSRLLVEYDALGHLTRWGEISYARNAFGAPLSIHFPDGTQETYSYNAAGHLIKKAERDGSFTTFERDYRGRAVRTQRYSSSGHLISEESAAYNGNQLVSATDAEGITTHFCHNFKGQLIRQKRGSKETLFEYDSLGRLERERTHTAVTAYEYDLLGRLIKSQVEDQQGRPLLLNEYEYDELGNCTLERTYDKDGRPIERHYEYDPLACPRQIMDPCGQVTRISKQGQSLLVAYPNGCENTVSFDSRGHPTAFEHRDASHRLLQNCIAQQNAEHLLLAYDNGSTNEWRYGPLHRIESVDSTNYFYDAYSRLTCLQKPGGETHQFEYDSISRLSHRSGPDFSYKYSCDKVDRVTKVTSPSSFDSEFYYNQDGHLVEEHLANGLKLSYEVDELGRRTKIILPDNSSIAYGYDAAFLREVSRLNPSGEVLYTHRYTRYDLAGRLIEMYPIFGQPITFTWDPCSRLTEVDQWHATYDPIGNLLSLNEQPFAYDELDRLIKDDDRTYAYDKPSNRKQTDSFIYDANGRVVRIDSHDQHLTLRYDSLDRLTEVESDQLLLQFTYDAFNRRLSKEVHLQTAEGLRLHSRLRYLWVDGFEIGAVNDQDEIVELRVLGTGLDSERFATVAIELDGKVYQPLHDFHGNIAGLIASDSRLIESYSFSAFGEMQGHSQLSNPWLFAAKRLDHETGLVYFINRYYHPPSGQWLTPDPLGPITGPNPYVYCHNNPFRWHDPTGLEPERVPSREPSWPVCRPPPIELPPKPIKPIPPKPQQREPMVPTWRRILEQGAPEPPRPYTIRGQGTYTSPNIRVGFINGICTTYKAARNHANLVSQCGNGCPVEGVYSPTFGGHVRDGAIAAVDLWCGSIGTPTILLMQNWKTWIEAGIDHYYIQVCYSGGAIHTRNALMASAPNINKRVVVIGVAPAAFISDEICAEAIHLCINPDLSETISAWLSGKESYDIVPCWDFSGKKICESTTIKLKSASGSSRFDHDLNSPTYQPELEYYLRDAQVKYGRTGVYAHPIRSYNYLSNGS